ncbi:MAG: ComF family protein [Lachnospiraceae bacterium]|nr:ComF family protein [Lachnospiraceae bacterium]
MKKKDIIMKMAKEAVSLLFPPRCPVCDEAVRRRDGQICRDCRSRLKMVEEPFCLSCGRPLPEEKEQYCADCASKKHKYIRGRALYEYESAAESIYRFKYGGRREYAEFFGREMAEKLEGYIRKASPDALVPVPLSRKRFGRRGYNQAQLLAEVMGEELGIPVYTHLAARVRDTLPQKELNAQERQNNLKRAFKIIENDVKLNTIIIIDDIYTTGSTIDALAEVFQQSGVEKVYFVTLSVGSRG